MTFFDKVERNPEDQVLVLRTRKEVNKELEKDPKKEVPIFEIAREINQPDRMCFCRIKVKDLKVNDGFYNDKEEYISFRTN